MKVRHGNLGLEVPDSWSDQSTLLFVAPLPEAPALPMLRAQDEPTEAVSVAFRRAQGKSAQALLEEQAQALSTMDEGFVVLSSGPFSSGLGPGWKITQRVLMGGAALRQISAAFVLGPVAVIATAAASDARFERVEVALTQVLRSLSAGSAT